MIGYLRLMRKVLDQGDIRPDRTRTGRVSLFGEQLKLDISQNFPLLTTKKVWIKGVVHELLWFLSGSTNVNDLKKEGVHIWNEWADENGSLGPVYGKQWRNCDGVDQIKGLIDQIKDDPYSSRHILSAWNVRDIDRMGLPPCHMTAQFYADDNLLSTVVYMRSCDLFLGLPFNIASYALLTHLIAFYTHKVPDKLTFFFGDIHVYRNHRQQCAEQLKRSPAPLPTLNLVDMPRSIFDVRPQNIELHNYYPKASIPAPIAV